MLKSDWEKLVPQEQNLYKIDKARNYTIRISSLKAMMWENCGIVRTDSSLIELRDYITNELDILSKNNSISYPKLRYGAMLKTAMLIVKSSLKRNENVGTFWKEYVGE